MGIIGSIRKHSWVAVGIVGLAIVCFIIGDLTKNNRGNQDMGKICGNTITWPYFDEQVQEAKYMQYGPDQQVPSDVETQLREQVWQRMVNEIILNTQYEKMGLMVTAAEMSDMYTGQFIANDLRQIFTDPATGAYDVQRVRAIIENFDQLDTASRRQWVQIEKNARDSRMQQKYVSMIAGGFYMPNTLATQMADLSKRAVDARMVQLAFSDVKDDEAAPSDKDFVDYYNEHREDFSNYNLFRTNDEVREMVYITFPVLPTPADREAIKTEVDSTYSALLKTDATDIPFFVNSESHGRYDSSYVRANTLPAPMDSIIARLGTGDYMEPMQIGNQWVMAKVMATAMRPDSLRAGAILILNSNAGSQFRTDDQAKALADSLEAVLRTGSMTFEEAVAQFSDDPQKNENHGDQGWMKDGDYGFINERLIQSHTGDYFVIRDPRNIGYQVIRVSGKTPDVKKYRLARIVRDIEPSEATANAIHADATSFAGQNRSYDAFVAAAQQANLQWRTDRPTMMDNAVQGVRSAREIVRWAFNEETKIGDVAAQVFNAEDEAGNTLYVVASLKDIYKDYATLDQMRQSIEPLVRMEKKAAMLTERAKEAKAAGGDIAAMASKLGANVDTVYGVSYSVNGLGAYGWEPKVQGALAVAAPNTVVGPIKGTSGIFLMEVYNTEERPVEADAIRNQQQQSFMMSLNYYLLNVLMDHAKIVDHRNLFF